MEYEDRYDSSYDKPKSKFLKLLIPIITVIAILVAGYFYNQVRILKQDPQAAAKKEVADLVKKVGRLVVLPEGETPTIATVSDPDALKDQGFFAKAQKGDKVLIYSVSKKAILYSVELDKIIEVSPLNVGPKESAQAPEPTPPAPVVNANPTPVKKPTKK